MTPTPANSSAVILLTMIRAVCGEEKKKGPAVSPRCVTPYSRTTISRRKEGGKEGRGGALVRGGGGDLFAVCSAPGKRKRGERWDSPSSASDFPVLIFFSARRKKRPPLVRWARLGKRKKKGRPPKVASTHVCLSFPRCRHVWTPKRGGKKKEKEKKG